MQWTLFIVFFVWVAESDALSLQEAMTLSSHSSFKASIVAEKDQVAEIHFGRSEDGFMYRLDIKDWIVSFGPEKYQLPDSVVENFLEVWSVGQMIHMSSEGKFCTQIFEIPYALAIDFTGEVIFSFGLMSNQCHGTDLVDVNGERMWEFQEVLKSLSFILDHLFAF